MVKVPTFPLSLFHTMDRHNMYTTMDRHNMDTTMDRHNMYTTMPIQPPVPMPFCATQTQTFSSRITTSKGDATTAKL